MLAFSGLFVRLSFLLVKKDSHITCLLNQDIFFFPLLFKMALSKYSQIYFLVQMLLN